MAKAKRERRSSFRTMQSGDDVLSRLDAIEALEAAEERARAEALPEAEEDDAEEAREG
ncbi:MAG: hypothetical protein ACPHET_07145 [Miltoncostaeaceae bacterium]|jgi:hypothetical protein